MKIGDLVRNKHTVVDTPADERGIVVEVAHYPDEEPWNPFARVVWVDCADGRDYETWMDCDDLEVVA